MELSPNLERELKKAESILKKYKIIFGVVIAALVVTSVGLGLGLGLKPDAHPVKSEAYPQVSCRNRCHDKPTGQAADCQCDSQCAAKGNCCWDFEDICQNPAHTWACSRLRCGERRRSEFRCSCSDDCLKAQDCCTNYNSVCKGETTWAADKCSPIPEPQCPKGFTLPPLILFSLDGFRAEYLQTWGALMPNIEKLKMCGTHSKYLRAVYPTKTFPNHYSIVTGLYPESNGIIDNSMYDVHLNKSFSLSGNEKFSEVWWKGQPIWLTAMYHNLKAGTYFWPGSDVKLNGSYPNLYKLYNKSAIYEDRVTTILQWLDLPPAKRPDFYTLYIEEPDTSGHSFGPVSGGVIKALMLADWTVGMLMDGLKQRNLHKCVNLILLADHGMDKTYCEQLEYMTNYFSNINSFYMYDGPAARLRARIIPKDYFIFDSAGIVKNLTCRRPDQHFKPYLTPDLPKRFHYANNIRIDKVHLYVDKQWLAVRDKSYTFCGGGNHGYDNEFKSMAAIFVGYGPGFKEGVEVEAFDNIEVYNMMCDLMKISPAPNNGTHGSLNHLLKKPVYIPSHPKEVTLAANCHVPNPVPGDTSGCTCKVDNATAIKLRHRLNLTTEDTSQSEKLNLPYGRPRVLQKISTYCLLHQHDYVSGYSHDILMPLWTAYTIDKTTSKQIEPRRVAFNASHTGASSLPPTLSDCLRTDPRIPEAKSQKCSNYKPDLNITHGFLFPPNFNRTALGQYDGLITSNFVPMYEEFKKIWHHLHEVLLLQYAAERNGLNVISGPVFDYNYDGHFDSLSEIVRHVHGTGIPIPTHFFVVLTSCKNGSGTPTHCTGNLNVLSYIIPHRPDNTESCANGKPVSQWAEERLKAHTARVRDVELLTGLDFYQDRNQPLVDILQLKTFLPSFETIVN